MQWLLNSTVYFHSRRSLSSLSSLSQLLTAATNTHSLLLRLLHQPTRRPSLQIHAQLLTSGLHLRRIAGDSGATLWDALIRLYSHGCSPEEAIHLYKQMLHLYAPSISSNTFTFSFLLKACANSSRPAEGAAFHSIVVKKGFEFHVYVHTALVNMYAECGCLADAKKAFDEMPERNSVVWNAMITGASKWGHLELARSLFEQMPDRNVVSWTGMIDGCTRCHKLQEALALFVHMMAEGSSPTEITILAIVPAVSNLGALDFGESLHAYTEKKGLGSLDIRVVNSLLDMYAKCGSIKNSQRLFEETSDRRNLVSWTSIISGFAMHGMADKAVELFEKMRGINVRPNQVTFLSVLNACSHGGLVEEGMRFFSSMVHDYGIKPEVKHYGCMIDMLGRTGRLAEAEEMIEEMPPSMRLNVIVWRTLLGCCSKYGDVKMGERVMRRLLELEREYGGDYVVLSNMLTESGRFDDAERLRILMNERKVVKFPGLSLIDENV